MEKYITKNGIKYELRGEQYYPMLEISEQTNYEIGKYGHLHLDFIKKHRRGTYTTLLTEGRLNEHLHIIDEQKEIFEKFHDCWSEYMSLGEAAIFEYAFKLGARLMMESLSDND